MLDNAVLDNTWNWLLANQQWVFSGVGASIIAAVLTRFLRGRQKESLAMKSGILSSGVQIARDLHVTIGQPAISVAEKSGPAVLDEVTDFLSRSRKVTDQLRLACHARLTGDRNSIVVALGVMEEQDSIGLGLQLRARERLSDPEVDADLFEFFRRLSLSRQALGVAELPYLDQAAAIDQAWVDVQARRVVSSVARASGIESFRNGVPLVIGFNVLGSEPDAAYYDGDQPPSGQLIYQHGLEIAKAQWEALGHSWDPSLPEPSFKANIPRSVPAITEAPCRESTPDISDGKARTGIPFEETHKLRLWGYDEILPIVYEDNRERRLDVVLTTRATRPAKTFAALKSGVHPIDSLSLVLANKLTRLIRRRTFLRLDSSLRAVEQTLQTSLEKEFDQFGYTLSSLKINLYSRRDQAHQGRENSLET